MCGGGGENMDISLRFRVSSLQPGSISHCQILSSDCAFASLYDLIRTLNRLFGKPKSPGCLSLQCSVASALHRVVP